MPGKEKTLSSLDWRLPDGYLFHFRFADNRAYLEGQDGVPHVGGHGKVWWHAGRLVRGGFMLLALVICLFAIYSAVWNAAPSTKTTSLRVQKGTRGQDLVYTYEVNGKSFERTESPGSTYSSSWENGDGQATVRYLAFRPDQAHLDFNIERFSWFNAIAIELFVLSLAYAGHAMMKTQQRLQRLVQRCTHVLPGTVSQVVPGQGYRLVTYQALAPDGEQSVRGSVQVGEAEKVKNDLVQGASVAVLYSDLETHTLL